jgi:hypothetical protein
MELIGSYTASDPCAVELRDIETRELVASVPQQWDSRRSMRWTAEAWAQLNGHTIAEWDYSNLNEGALRA